MTNAEGPTFSIPEHGEPSFEILIVDDEPDNQRLLQEALGQLGRCEVSSPEEVSLDDVTSADLILMDLTIDDAGLNNEKLPLGQRPRDGLALAAVLRSHLAGVEQVHPTAFALHTSHLTRLVPHLPGHAAEHVVARLNNLEWAFGKAPIARAGRPRLVERISTLASAAHALPAVWTELDAIAMNERLSDLFGIDRGSSWAESALASALSAHPPVFELSESSHGLAFLRWLLHRILPYPCFLLDSYWLAARLAVDPLQLEESLRHDGDIKRLFDQSLYRGVAAGFDGPRYWRVGVDALLYEISHGDLFDRQRIVEGLRDLSGGTLKTWFQPGVVVRLNGDYGAAGVDHPSSLVRIQPDDWPPYASAVYASQVDIDDDPRLRRVVLDEDRQLLGDL